MLQYITYKHREADVNALTDGRRTIIKAHLCNMNVKVKRLATYYFEKKGIALQTIRNELASHL